MAVVETKLTRRNGRGDASGNGGEKDAGAMALAMAGARIRHMRYMRGLSIRQLEELSGVNRNSIARAEAGRRIVYDALLRICSALELHPGQLIESAHVDELAAIQRPDELVWFPRNNEDAARVASAESLRQPNQRREFVASQGLMNFMAVFDTADDERFTASTMELYEPTQVRTHRGQEFLYVLEGRVALTVRDRRYELDAGTTASFSCGEPHTYAPLGQTLPARILTVAIRPPVNANGKGGDQDNPEPGTGGEA